MTDRKWSRVQFLLRSLPSTTATAKPLKVRFDSSMGTPHSHHPHHYDEHDDRRGKASSSSTGRSSQHRFQLGGMTDLEGRNSANASRAPSSDEDDSHPGTPSFLELRRTLSVKTLQAIDAKSVRASVWRPPYEAPRRPRDLDQLIMFAIRGGLRASYLSCHHIASYFRPAAIRCLLDGLWRSCELQCRGHGLISSQTRVSRSLLQA